MISQWGLNFFGPNASNLFGVEDQYMMQVVYPETFNLVGYGFDYQSIMKMPIALRRHFFMMLVEKNKKEREADPPPQSTR